MPDRPGSRSACEARAKRGAGRTLARAAVPAIVANLFRCCSSRHHHASPTDLARRPRVLFCRPRRPRRKARRHKLPARLLDIGSWPRRLGAGVRGTLHDVRLRAPAGGRGGAFAFRLASMLDG